jgi:hypothetical protein
VQPGIVIGCAIVASASQLAAEPRRAVRPHAVTGGVSLLGGYGEALPYVTAQGVIDLDPRFSVVADLGYFGTGDRLFGPRVLLRGGLRAYLRDGTWSPFVAAIAVAYHQFDVDYAASDASQQAASSLGGGGTLGHELVTRGGLSWVIEMSALGLHPFARVVTSGLLWELDTTVGYRF